MTRAAERQADKIRRPAPASSQAVASRMRLQSRRDTGPELAIRRLLFARGFRYRVHYPVPQKARRSIDIAFPKKRLAVFVDGCFWHGCRLHKTIPVANRGWWTTKIEANRRRDRETDAWLEEQDWAVCRIWEHESAEQAARQVEARLRELSGRPTRIRA